MLALLASHTHIHIHIQQRAKVERLESLVTMERTRKYQQSSAASIPELVKERRAEEAERALESENQALQAQLAAARQQRGEVEERYENLQQQFNQALASGSFSLDVGMPGSPSLVPQAPSMTPVSDVRLPPLCVPHDFLGVALTPPLPPAHPDTTRCVDRRWRSASAPRSAPRKRTCASTAH